MRPWHVHKNITLAVLITTVGLLLPAPRPVYASPNGYRLPFVGQNPITTGPGCSDTHKSVQSREAMDFGMPEGTHIYATQAGQIIYASEGWNDGYGNLVKISHEDGNTSFYAHLSKFVKTRGHVDQGEHIAFSGKTGDVKGKTGEHLHFEIRDGNNKAVSFRDMEGITLFESAKEPPCRPQGENDGEAVGPPLVQDGAASENLLEELDYFALGDSLASGHGLMDDTKDGFPKDGCRRSDRSYPYIVAAQLRKHYKGVNFTHYACSGATSIVPNEVKYRYKWLHNQVDDVIRNLSNRPTLVSITIGANDFGWSDPERLIGHVIEPSDRFLSWTASTAEAVAVSLKIEVARLLAYPNVGIVLTTYHNPFNTESIYFLGIGGLRACNDILGVLTCYERTKYLINDLNSAIVLKVWTKLNHTDRLRVTPTLNPDSYGHGSPSPACGKESQSISETWIQYPGDPDSNGDIPDLLKRMTGQQYGDCFHLNQRGAEAFAAAVFNTARRLTLIEQPDAHLTTQSIPIVLKPGEIADVSFELQNISAIDWPSNDKFLLTHISGPSLNLRTQQSLPATIPRGAPVEWRLRIKAPNLPQVYDSVWRMAFDGALFGPNISIPVVVLPHGSEAGLGESIKAVIEKERDRLTTDFDNAWTDLKAQIQEMIIAEIRRQIQNLLANLCGTVPAGLIIAVSIVWQRGRRR